MNQSLLRARTLRRSDRVLRRERLANRGDSVSVFQVVDPCSGSSDPRICRAKLSNFAAVLKIAHRGRSDHSVADVTLI